jgi:hypothetical protein
MSRRRAGNCMRVCEHCGAVWDKRHETEGCPVVNATRLILRHPPRDERSFDDAMLDALVLACAQVGGPTLNGDGRNPDWEGMKRWLQEHLVGPFHGIARGRHYEEKR